MTFNRNGRLPARFVRRATAHMVRESYEHVEVYRERGSSPVTSFRTRIVQATSGVVGALRERVQGDAAKVYHYMAAPVRADIVRSDVVWRGSDRFLVVAIEARASETQVLLQRVQ